MTYAPPTLAKLAAYWTTHGGINLGIVGDVSHVAKGTSYHLGKDQLATGAYSTQTARDRAGLTNAASAIDLGRLNGTYAGLRQFSKWLVDEARHNKPGTSDMREIIYSPDGAQVLRWDRERGFASVPRGGEADTSHLTHTHISWYRDAEQRDHTTAFRPFFEEPAEEDMRSIIVGTGRVIGDVAAGTPYFESPGGKQVGTTGAGTVEWLGTPTLDDGATRDPAWCLIVGLTGDPPERVAGVARYIRRPALTNTRAFPAPAGDCSAWEDWYADAPAH